MNPKADILIVDDERHTREALMRYLRTRFTVTGAEDGAQAIDLLRTHDYDLVLTDLRMPGADGMSVLEAALAKGNHPACIVFTAYGTIEAAVAAVKAGAFDFVAKPVRLDRLDEVVNAALKHRAAKAAPQPAEPADGAPAEAKSAPPLSGDSTTSVQRQRPLMIRLRCGKFALSGSVPGGYSLRIMPSCNMELYNFLCTYGYTTSTPLPSTAADGICASSAPAEAIPSTPSAIPLTTIAPAEASS